MAGLKFEWDDAKNAANIAKHGVDFADACDVFMDFRAIDRIDDREDYREERFVILGMAKGRLLTIAYTVRGDATRIISARGATPYEQRKYREEER